MNERLGRTDDLRDHVLIGEPFRVEPEAAEIEVVLFLPGPLEEPEPDLVAPS